MKIGYNFEIIVVRFSTEKSFLSVQNIVIVLEALTKLTNHILPAEPVSSRRSPVRVKVREVKNKKGTVVGMVRLSKKPEPNWHYGFASGPVGSLH